MKIQMAIIAFSVVLFGCSDHVVDQSSDEKDAHEAAKKSTLTATMDGLEVTPLIIYTYKFERRIFFLFHNPSKTKIIKCHGNLFDFPFKMIDNFGNILSEDKVNALSQYTRGQFRPEKTVVLSWSMTEPVSGTSTIRVFFPSPVNPKNVHVFELPINEKDAEFTSPNIPGRSSVTVSDSFDPAIWFQHPKYETIIAEWNKISKNS